MQDSKPKFVFKLFFYLILQDYTYRLLFFYSLFLNSNSINFFFYF